MSAQAQRKWAAQEYLAFERESDGKSEFVDGEIFALAGASRTHNRIAWSVVAALDPQLDEHGCEGFVSDMRVRIPAADVYTYPDVVVVCGEPRFEDDELDVLLNPTLLIEILSPSTEADYRGRKSAWYRGLPTLAAYLMIAQDEPRVELYVRQDDGGWTLHETAGLDATVELPWIGATLAMRDVYARVPVLWDRG